MDVGSAWASYVKRLGKLDSEATKKVGEYIGSIPGFSFTNPDDMNKLVGYAYGISAKYGEGAAALACEMYDAIGMASGQILPPAEPADLPDMDEVAKTVRGTAKTGNPKNVSRSVGRLVKRTGADTTLKNAIRDGAEFAWIPNGDTCAFCITLASRGWQTASAKALKKGHAEHIHANCDCTYGVRFNGRPTYKNYDPDKYYDMYSSAEGKSSKDKINSLRRIRYQENKDRINAQKRAAYAERKAIERGYANILDRIGTNEVDMDYIRSQEYKSKFDKLSNDAALNEILYENAVNILNDNKGTDTETTMIFSGLSTIVNKKGEKDALGVSLTPGQIGMVRKKKNLVGIHNHPTNLPPNGSDIAASGSRGYDFGIVLTHDGRIYKYSHGKKPFLASALDKTIDKYKGKEYNLTTQEAFERALDEFKEGYGIKWQLIE